MTAKLVRRVRVLNHETVRLPTRPSSFRRKNQAAAADQRTNLLPEAWTQIHVIAYDEPLQLQAAADDEHEVGGAGRRLHVIVLPDHPAQGDILFFAPPLVFLQAP